jgi:hypothetical protein
LPNNPTLSREFQDAGGGSCFCKNLQKSKGIASFSRLS